MRQESRKAQISDRNPDFRENRRLKPFSVSHSSFYSRRQREISWTASDERGKGEMLEVPLEMPFCGVFLLTAELTHVAEFLEFADGLSALAFQYRDISGSVVRFLLVTE